MKFCKDCEHHLQGLCLSPENGQDPVTGGVKARDAYISRTDITLGYEKCGSSGDFFVPKVTYHQWWAFWRKW